MGGHGPDWDLWTAGAAGYEALVSPITRQAIEPVLGTLGPLARCELVDIACGPGHLLAVARARGARVTGVDLSPAMLALARDRAEGPILVEGDASVLPFTGSTFHAATSTFAFEHVGEAFVVLREAARVLRPGGAFAFAVWLGGCAGHDLARIVARAFWKHGTVADPSPPVVHPLAGSETARRALLAAGFHRPEARSGVAVSRHPDGWSVLDVMERAMPAAARAIDGQPSSVKRQIRRSIATEADALRVGASVVLNWPFVVVRARKREATDRGGDAAR